MRTIQIALLIFLVSFYVKMEAQAIITSGGDYFSNVHGSLSSTTGEPITETFSGTANILTQGFQQTRLYLLSISLPEEQLNPKLQIFAFPNPAKEFVKINIENVTTEHLSYDLFDVNGKLMLHNQFEPSETEIHFYQMSPGSYTLKIYADQKEMKAFKIIKQ